MGCNIVLRTYDSAGAVVNVNEKKNKKRSKLGFINARKKEPSTEGENRYEECRNLYDRMRRVIVDEHLFDIRCLQMSDMVAILETDTATFLEMLHSCTDSLTFDEYINRYRHDTEFLNAEISAYKAKELNFFQKALQKAAMIVAMH